MIAIIGAMESEIAVLMRAFICQETLVVADKQLFVGTLCGKQVVIAKSGIGKVNAAITTTAILTRHQVDYVLNIGVAGGVQGVAIGDIVLADAIAYFDVSLTEIDDVPYGKMGDDPLLVATDAKLRKRAEAIIAKQGYGWKIGTIVSGDRFVTELDHLRPIMAVVDNVLACEMEGMAVAICCHKFAVPFLSLRGISDMIDKTDQKATYSESLRAVCEKTGALALAFIREQ